MQIRNRVRTWVLTVGIFVSVWGSRQCKQARKAFAVVLLSLYIIVHMTTVTVTSSLLVNAQKSKLSASCLSTRALGQQTHEAKTATRRRRDG
ncbi:unnamed protein product [Caenorhabditis auriculariae]|uniref:Uncharacterized protein n=1 Tax=Caenorhabditis auriculariae TaxID=2777116 RepID=A0A8S1H980_9PELO|nr:unnamed protein product [Caenorhabditis auriculariae]